MFRPLVAAAYVALGAATAIAQSPTFRTLPVPAGFSSSSGEVLSGDGNHVGGSSYFDSLNRAFLWDVRGAAAQSLHPPGPFFYYSRISALSHDGSAAAVRLDNTAGGWFHWRASTGLVSIAPPTGYAMVAGMGDMSADGSVVVAAFDQRDAQWNLVRRDSFIWREQSGYEQVAFPAGTVEGSLHTLSGSGTMGAGFIQMGDFYSRRAAVWSQADGWSVLPLPANGRNAGASRISADGTAVIGMFDTLDSQMASFVWTADSGVVTLPTLPGGGTTYAFACSADGSAVVGRSDASWEVGNSVANLWTEALGLVDLNVYLPTIGIDLTGWQLYSARDISDDGQTIVGIGSRWLPNGTRRTETWVVTIPSGSTVGLLGCGAVVACRRRTRNGC